jgi:nitronate monooxygenase
MSDTFNNKFTEHTGIEVPIICGPMYPCSNPELVAAVSEAGGLGIVQPISLTYVHGYDFREGLKHIRKLTSNPIGMNALIEKSSKRYHEKMQQWIDIALEEDVKFFITSLGKPDWVVEKVHAAGGIVYHDVTERKWALKGIEAGVDGLIAVNNRAGGHAGEKRPQLLFDEIKDLGVPIICAGGIGAEEDFQKALDIGYQGVQMGTRFIATEECKVAEPYKNAVVKAQEEDIVLTDCVTGIPVSVIYTPYIKRLGLKAGFFARWLLRNPKMKHLMRMFYALKSIYQLKKAINDETGNMDYWQAGKSVAGVDKVESVADIIKRFSTYALGDSKK